VHSQTFPALEYRQQVVSEGLSWYLPHAACRNQARWALSLHGPSVRCSPGGEQTVDLRLSTVVAWRPAGQAPEQAAFLRCKVDRQNRHHPAKALLSSQDPQSQTRVGGELALHEREQVLPEWRAGAAQVANRVLVDQQVSGRAARLCTQAQCM